MHLRLRMHRVARSERVGKGLVVLTAHSRNAEVGRGKTLHGEIALAVVFIKHSITLIAEVVDAQGNVI